MRLCRMTQPQLSKASNTRSAAFVGAQSLGLLLGYLRDTWVLLSLVVHLVLQGRNYRSTSSLASKNPEQHRVGLVLGL